MARKLGVVSSLAIALLATGLDNRAAGQFRENRENPRAEIRGVIKSVDAGSITLMQGEGRESVKEQTYPLAKDVEIAVGGAAVGGRSVYFKEGKLADLGAGLRISLNLAADQKTVDSIFVAEGLVLRGQLRAVDAAKNTVTIAPQFSREAGGEERTLSLTANAEVGVDDGRGRRFSVREARLADLAPGATLTAWLTLDRKQVEAILAEGPMIFGTIKETNPERKSLVLVTRSLRGEDPAEEKTLTISSDAVLLLDDGKGRRLSTKEVKLADLPNGASAMIKLSTDQTFAMFVRAEGPTLVGLLKSVDADNGTISIAIPKGRDDAEEKTLTIAKDARISIDGGDSTLANLKVGDNGPVVQLRLSLDQRSVLAIVARQPERRQER